MNRLFDNAVKCSYEPAIAENFKEKKKSKGKKNSKKPNKQLAARYKKLMNSHPKLKKLMEEDS